MHMNRLKQTESVVCISLTCSLPPGDLLFVIYLTYTATGVVAVKGFPFVLCTLAIFRSYLLILGQFEYI